MDKKNSYNHKDRCMHQSWCLRNDIKIYYQPVTMSKGVIVIEDKGNKVYSLDEFRADNKPWKSKKLHKMIWSERIMVLYTTKYLEYNNLKFDKNE